MRAGNFQGTQIFPRDPNTGLPFPDQIIPADQINPSATKVMNMFYPLPNQGTAASGYGITSSSCRKRGSGSGSIVRLDCRGDQERLAVLPRQLSAPRPERDHFRGRQRVHQPADPRLEARHVVDHRRLDEDLSIDDGQRVPHRLQLRQFEAAEHLQSGGRRGQSRARKCAEPRRRSPRLPVISIHRPARSVP